MSCESFEGSNCSGSGICEQGLCFCELGWSNQSDFVQLADCPVYLPTVQILWGINLLVIFFMIVYCHDVFIFRATNFLTLRRERGIGLWQNKGLLSVFIYVAICLPAHTILAIYLIVSPNSHLGFDPVSSILQFVGQAGFATVLFVFQPAVLSSIFSKMDLEMTTNVRNYKITIWMAQILLAFASFLPVIMTLEALNESIQLEKYFFISFNILILVSSVLNCIVCVFIVRRIREVLKSASRVRAANDNGAKIQTLHNKLVVVEVISLLSFFSLAIGSLVCTAWSYMYTKYDYVNPFIWVQMPVIAAQAVLSIHYEKSQVKAAVKKLISSTPIGNIKVPTLCKRRYIAPVGPGPTNGQIGVTSQVEDPPMSHGGRVTAPRSVRFARGKTPLSRAKSIVGSMGILSGIGGIHSTRKGQRLGASFFEGEEDDVVVLQNIEDEFVPAADELLNTEVGDTSELILESLGATQAFQSKTVITTSEFVVKESELLFPGLKFFRRLDVQNGLLLLATLGVITMFLVLTAVLHPVYGYFTLIVLPIIVAALLSSCSLRVLYRLIWESGLIASSVIVLVLTVTMFFVLKWNPPLCIAFLYVPGGILVLLINDSFFGAVQRLRFGIVFLTLVSTLGVLILIQGVFLPRQYFTDHIFYIQLPNSLHGSEYSVYGVCRDSLLASLLIIIRVGVHLYRGKSSERFLNLSDPIKVSYKSMEDEALEKNKMKTVALKFGAGATKRSSARAKIKKMTRQASTGRSGGSLNVMSGFLVEQREAGEKRAVFVYCDHIVFRESDTFLMHWFGERNGVRIFHYLKRQVFSRILLILCILLPVVLFVLVLWGGLDSDVSVLCLLALIPVVRGFILTSRAMFYLLIRRLDFWLAGVSVLVWFASLCYVFEFDARIIAFFVGGIIIMNARLRDSHVHGGLQQQQPRRRGTLMPVTSTVQGRRTEAPGGIRKTVVDTVLTPQTSNARASLVYRGLIWIVHLLFLLLPLFLLFGLVPDVRYLGASYTNYTSGGATNQFFDKNDFIQLSIDSSFTFAIYLLARMLATNEATRTGTLLDLRRPIKPVFIETEDSMQQQQQHQQPEPQARTKHISAVGSTFTTRRAGGIVSESRDIRSMNLSVVPAPLGEPKIATVVEVVKSSHSPSARLPPPKMKPEKSKDTQLSLSSVSMAPELTEQIVSQLIPEDPSDDENMKL